MTRWLVIIAILVTVAFGTLIFWPDNTRSNRTPTPALVSQEPAAQPSNFTVLVDGKEAEIIQRSSGSRMADVPVSQWNSSTISHIRTIGTTQIVVFVDGSETIIDSFVRERMPQDVAYRAGYSRDE